MRRFDDRLLLSPSDLNSLLECRHLMTLEVARFRGEPGPKPVQGAHTAILVRYGEQHEAEVLRRMEAEGRQIVRIETGRTQDELRAAIAQTAQAMRDGAEVIHQAALVAGSVGGYADFLERVERPSVLGEWSYEPADAKLARVTKPYFLVQLSAYGLVLEQLQQLAPDELAVLLGDGTRDPYRANDFAAYVRRLEGRALGLAEAGPGETYPLPCAHCPICGYRHACEARRERDDHLSLVAGLARDQARKLEEAGVPTLTALAELPEGKRVPQLAGQTLATLRRQATLQLSERRTGTPRYELLDTEDGRGLELLPEPAEGDLFFDIEGDPYIGDKGLEYLLGVGWLENGEERYTVLWAHDREQERVAFERLIDLFAGWRAAHPGAHIYHYASYEEQALKALAMYHATREAEVDDLLRTGALVDLYRVVRQSVAISKPSYSLKQVEDFYPFAREAKVKEAGGSIVAYEHWLLDRDPAALEEIAQYNREDCHSTRRLRDWLLGLRDERIAGGHEVPWRPDPEPQTSEKREAEDEQTGRLREALRARGDDEAVLLAELLLYHRREAKPGWWWWFERLQKSDEQLRDDDAEAIGSLEPAGPETQHKQSRLVPMRFPPQVFKLGPGDDIADPVTERAIDVVEMDADRRTLTLRLGSRAWGDAVPRSLIPGGPWMTEAQRAALRTLAASVLARDGAYPASEALLRGDDPQVTAHPPGTPLLAPYSPDGAVDVALRLDRSVLPIQGPPGTGKTYCGARIALALIAAGRRVGVTAPSHKAIHNLLEEIERLAGAAGVRFRGLKASSSKEHAYASPLGDAGMIETVGSADCEGAEGDVRLIAGTAWLFCRAGMRGALDTLIVDEAGQVSLADTLAVSLAARNLVLLGDPQQLAQVAQGGHPEGTAVSALGHLLGELRTMPPERGLFIDMSRRMHPDVCRFVSEISYARELHSLAECANQRVISPGLTGSGLRAQLVAHRDNRRESIEECEVIAREVALLAGGTVVTASNEEIPIERAGVMVVTPYNAQVRRLRACLPEWVNVGTVDKFQGREAAVVFFSMATSSGADIPRNVEFLLSRNRLNVAISRARCIAVLVASPELLAIPCRTVEQLRLANALCRFVELAE